MKLKVRLEAEIEKDGAVTSANAVADALEACAKKMRADLRWCSAEMLDVPRGRLVYQIEKDDG